MDLFRLKVFLHVMRLGSYAEAARSLRLDPSAVSRAITALEDDLAVKLFHRTTRKLSATEDAQILLRSVEPAIEELERAHTALHERKATPNGTIRITSPVSFALLVITPLLAKFHKLYPDVKVDFIVSDSVLDLIEDRIDVAIRLGHLVDSSFVAIKLTDLEYVACASPKYLKDTPSIRQPSDLLKHNCHQFVLPNLNSGWKFRSRKTQIEETANVSGYLRISSALALKVAALDGSGISLLPRILITEDLEKGRLVDVLPKYEGALNEFGSKSWLVYPSKEYLPNKTKAFIDFLRREL